MYLPKHSEIILSTIKNNLQKRGVLKFIHGSGPWSLRSARVLTFFEHLQFNIFKPYLDLLMMSIFVKSDFPMEFPFLAFLSRHTLKH